MNGRRWMPHAKRHAWVPLMVALAGLSGHAAAGDPKVFVSAAGYTPVDVDTFGGSDYYTPQRFPHVRDSLFHPDSELAPPVRALLLFQSREGVLPHARYKVTEQVDSGPRGEPVSLVEVTRFNLGPAVRADLAQTALAEHLASAEAFGDGPHVSWRFVMTPIQGMIASLRHASRRELPADADIDCLGASCTALDSSTGPDGDWQVRPAPQLPLSYTVTQDGVTHPARILATFIEGVGETSDWPVPSNDGSPRLMFVLSHNPGGQVQNASGLGRNAVVFDDSIETQWLRWQEMVGVPPQLEELSRP